MSNSRLSERRLTSEQLLSAKLTMPNEKDMRQIFESFDRDRDNVLRPDELIDILRALGLNPTKAECKDIAHEYDKDAGAEGVLDFAEFQALVTAFWTSGAETRLIDAFRSIDKNKSGFIEFRELRNVLMNYGDDKMTDEEVIELVTTMVDQADLDFDHKIDYFEYSRMLTQSSFKDMDK